MSKSITLYNGGVLLEFDPQAHAYKWQGMFVPGVTTILRVLDKPALVQWASNMAVEFIREGYLASVRSDDGVLSESAFLALCEQAKTAHRRISREAADIGSAVHKFAEATLSGERPSIPSDPQTAKGAAAFLNWSNAHTIKPIHVERMVFSKNHFYAGTCDFFGHIDGELCVLDLKTSSGLYLEMPLQLAAYAVAIEEEGSERINHGWIVRLDKKTGKPSPYYLPIRQTLKDAWLRVREAHRAVQKVDEYLVEVKDATSKGLRACLTSTASTVAAVRT